MEKQNPNELSSEMKILLVDDDPIFIMLQSRIIRLAGIDYEISEVQNGSDALEWINQCLAMPHLIIIFLDINMPIMDGWEFLDNIENHPLKKYLKVIIVTSSVSPSDKIKAQQYPNVIHFIEKPINVQHIQDIFALPTLLDLSIHQP